MEKENQDLKKYITAKERVGDIKMFYINVVRLLIFTALLFAFKGRILQVFKDKGITDTNFLQWVDWNVIAIPIIGALILVFIGLRLFVFKTNWMKEWEDRQIRKIIEDDNSYL